MLSLFDRQGFAADQLNGLLATWTMKGTPPNERRLTSAEGDWIVFAECVRKKLLRLVEERILVKEMQALSETTYLPGPTADTVRSSDGQVHAVPIGWSLLPPGDAAMTRRVKAHGNHWVVQEKKGRKLFSRGVWAPTATIERIRGELESERSTEAFANRRAADAKRRERVQSEYVEDFAGAVVTFLAFHPDHLELAKVVARVVTQHATPVGSGTVARTKRIPIEQRAEAAVIAWMRHQTTGYDDMVIPRVKGKRREVRRMLAQRSKELLARYRRGEPLGAVCPLAAALANPGTPS